MRKYKLYTSGPHQSIHNKSKDYRSGMWIVEVRASSIKQAFWLLGNVQVATGNGAGIISVDNSWGPDEFVGRFPWSSELYPEHWE